MMKTLLTTSALAATLALLPVASFAQTERNAAVSEAVSENPIVIDKQAPAAQTSAAASKLIAKAKAKGNVRVIANLKLTLKDEDALSASEATAQTQALKAAQSAVITRVLGKADAEGAVTFDYIPFVSLFVDATQVGKLIADPDVIHIQEDVPMAPSLAQSVPFIRAPQVWNAGASGTGIVVAVLDTGVDKTHTMFPGAKIASEACYSTTNAGQNSTTVCPGGAQATTAVNSGVNCAASIQGCDHGTHVAGIVAGNRASPVLRGVAKDARIIAIQVFSSFANPNGQTCGSGFTGCARSFQTDQVKGLERVFALRNQFKIASINMSLGGGQFTGPCDSTIAAHKAVIAKLRTAKIATVIASGNDGFTGAMGSPACASNAIAVGSTEHTSNAVSSFSNHTPLVRLMAPGSNINSSVPGTTTSPTGIKSGTSMATPHVAGAFALLKNVRGGATVDDMAAALECTGLSTTAASDVGIHEPRIDVNAARTYLLAPPGVTSTFNFNNSATELPKWPAFIGARSISNGFMNVAVNTAGWKLTYTTGCNESQAITSKIRRALAANQTNFAGIVFKAQLDTVTVSPQQKWISGYYAAIAPDGTTDHDQNVVILRFDRYNLVTNTGGFAFLCNANVPITSGTTYTLKVISTGGSHRVYVNGTLRCSATDQSYGTGKAGLMTFVSTPVAGQVFTADNFIVDPTDVPSPAATAADVAAVSSAAPIAMTGSISQAGK